MREETGIKISDLSMAEAERDAARNQATWRAYQMLRKEFEEAMSIIKDLADLHDSYIVYLVAHNNYNEPAAKAISERIQALRLRQ